MGAWRRRPPRTAMIIGGTGQLGAAAARRLAVDGWSVLVAHRGNHAGDTSLADLDVTTIRLDRDDTVSLLARARGPRPGGRHGRLRRPSCRSARAAGGRCRFARRHLDRLGVRRSERQLPGCRDRARGFPRLPDPSARDRPDRRQRRTHVLAAQGSDGAPAARSGRPAGEHPATGRHPRAVQSCPARVVLREARARQAAQSGALRQRHATGSARRRR